ncbi:hypothetical protein BSKO_13532 [Bryopsis sp. KO-2023]|nr:hypothetical protein BSKO_13532 [Bryopsis sp. KO-2023]
MDDGSLLDDAHPPAVRLRERISSLPPQNVLEQQAPQVNLASRRAKSEPADFDVFPQRSSTYDEKEHESPAAIFAKWLKKHLIVGGGRRVSVKEPEVVPTSDDSINEALMGKANGRIDILQDRMERARARIRKLEGDIVEQRKKFRVAEQSSEKKVEQLETLVHDLQAKNLALSDVTCSAQSAVQKTQELTLYAQSQIRVFGVMLREHLIPEENRNERLEMLVDNLEEVGRSLNNTGELLEGGERYLLAKHTSVATPRTQNDVSQGNTKDEACSCSELRSELERLESELAGSLDTKEDLETKLQGAYAMISELKYEAAKSANCCVALEQGMTLLGAQLNSRDEGATVERHKPDSFSSLDGHNSLTQPTSTASIVEGEVRQELKGLLYYLKESGCWVDQEKGLHDLGDLLSEVRSATAASVHKIMVLEDHKAEALGVIGSLRRDFQAACAQLEVEAKKGEVLRQELTRFNSKNQDQEDGYSGQLDAIGRKLDSFTMDHRDMRSELRMLSDLQQSYGSQIPDMVGGLHHQIASLQQIVSGMERKDLSDPSSQIWDPRFESGFGVGSNLANQTRGDWPDPPLDVTFIGACRKSSVVS